MVQIQITNGTDTRSVPEKHFDAIFRNLGYVRVNDGPISTGGDALGDFGGGDNRAEANVGGNASLPQSTQNKGSARKRAD